ncbi:MAG: hypothetical protein OEO17_05540 [Gemmatimonadota bacterium]|nr:hypothetical protein [Gemmatimonadota bacterium]MDH3367286.1 hypothetical protein [Gemmatimonadota bacterium]
MAQSVTRWVFAGVLACCAVAVALLPPRDITVRYQAPFVSDPGRLNRERLRFEDALARLRLLRLRDSLPQLPGRALEPNGRLRLVADPGLPPRIVDVIALLSEQSWKRSAPHDTTVSVMVAALIDTAGEVERFRREVPRYMQISHLVPTTEGRTTCLRVVDFGVSEVEAYTEGHSPVHGWRSTNLRRGMGACTYYAAFGAPGRDIARWLATWRYLPIANADWSGAEPEERYARSRDYGRWLDADFTGCAAGDLTRCRLAVWNARTVWNARGPGGWPAQFAEFDVPGVVFSGRYWFYSYRYGHGLGPAAQEYLGDMVGRFGRDRFERFWTSDAPLEEAFEEAMGMPLDEWTMQWARTYIGVPRTACHLPWGSAILSLVLAAALVGGAGLYARRWQVA